MDSPKFVELTARSEASLTQRHTPGPWCAGHPHQMGLGMWSALGTVSSFLQKGANEHRNLLNFYAQAGLKGSALPAGDQESTTRNSQATQDAASGLGRCSPGPRL